MSVQGEFHRYRESLLECVRAHPGPGAERWVDALVSAEPAPDRSLSEQARRVRELLAEAPEPPASGHEPERFRDLLERLGAITRIILG